jgi:hypothetical protein
MQGNGDSEQEQKILREKKVENKAGLRASPALVEFGYFCEESETRGDALGATICAPITSPETTNSTRRFC